MKQDLEHLKLLAIFHYVVAGMTALFVTEEGIRGALGEMRLPKEALAYLAQQTDKTRRELFGEGAPGASRSPGPPIPFSRISSCMPIRLLGLRGRATLFVGTRPWW